MKIKTSWPVFILILATAALQAGGQDESDKKKDRDKIVGTWLMVSGVHGGEKAPDDVVSEFRLTFAKDGKIMVKIEGRDLDGTFELRPAKKPKEVDFVVDGKDMKGIYEFAGDNLKMCVGRNNEERPKTFASEAGTETMLLVLKRQKK